MTAVTAIQCKITHFFNVTLYRYPHSVSVSVSVQVRSISIGSIVQSGISLSLVYWIGVVTIEGEGQFCGVSRYNQWGLCLTVVWKCVNRSSCHLGWWVCIRWGQCAARGKERFGRLQGVFSPFVWIAHY